MNVADVIARLEALDKAATPGPWRNGYADDSGAGTHVCGPLDIGEHSTIEHKLICTTGHHGDPEINSAPLRSEVANLLLIIALRNELPRLLRLLRAGRGRMLEALERCEDYMDQRADADLAPGGEAMQPNREMVHLQEIRAALREWDEAARG